jgi:hypothetical protein
MGSSCDCPKPPGGRVNCAPNQLAICRVENGEVKSHCIDPHPSFTRPGTHDRSQSLARNNWALQVITGIERTPEQELSGDDWHVLTSRRYHDPSRGLVVTFSVPWNIEGPYRPPPKVPLVPPLAPPLAQSG